MHHEKRCASPKSSRLTNFFLNFVAHFFATTLDDLGANKVMGNVLSSLRSFVPWQARAKDLKPIPWFVQNKLPWWENLAGFYFRISSAPHVIGNVKVGRKVVKSGVNPVRKRGTATKVFGDPSGKGATLSLSASTSGETTCLTTPRRQKHPSRSAA